MEIWKTCCICVKRTVIHTIEWFTVRARRLCVSSAINSALDKMQRRYRFHRIRWNERLSCAYKHSGYAFSFSTEWWTVVRVWHVQNFFIHCVYFFVLLYVLCLIFFFIFAVYRSANPIVYSIFVHSKNKNRRLKTNMLKNSHHSRTVIWM